MKKVLLTLALLVTGFTQAQYYYTFTSTASWEQGNLTLQQFIDGSDSFFIFDTETWKPIDEKEFANYRIERDIVVTNTSTVGTKADWGHKIYDQYKDLPSPNPGNTAWDSHLDPKWTLGQSLDIHWTFRATLSTQGINPNTGNWDTVSNYAFGSTFYPYDAGRYGWKDGQVRDYFGPGHLNTVPVGPSLDADVLPAGRWDAAWSLVTFKVTGSAPGDELFVASASVGQGFRSASSVYNAKEDTYYIFFNAKNIVAGDLRFELSDGKFPAPWTYHVDPGQVNVTSRHYHFDIKIDPKTRKVTGELAKWEPAAKKDKK